MIYFMAVKYLSLRVPLFNSRTLGVVSAAELFNIIGTKQEAVLGGGRPGWDLPGAAVHVLQTFTRRTILDEGFF